MLLPKSVQEEACIAGLRSRICRADVLMARCSRPGLNDEVAALAWSGVPLLMVSAVLSPSLLQDRDGHAGVYASGSLCCWLACSSTVGPRHVGIPCMSSESCWFALMLGGEEGGWPRNPL